MDVAGVSITGFKVTNHPQQIRKRGAEDATDDRGTEQSFVDELAAKLGGPFTLDVAASAMNAKARTYYTREQDGLTQPWIGRVWCNPPYSDCASWVRKAWQEWNAGTPDIIVMLLPANRTEQRWWQEQIEPFRDVAGNDLRTTFLPGRMRFDRPGAVISPKGDRPPFGCVLLIWGAK
jgi:phage N-6-adenine-methyltransferase